MHWMKVITVLALVAITTSCANPASTQLPSQPKSIALIGDSISVGSAKELGDVFGTQFGWHLNQYAVGGMSVVRMRDVIRERAALRPDAMVIELGSNDMGLINARKPDVATQQVRFAEAVSQMQGAMDDMAGVPCVVWVNVNTWSLIYDGQYDLRTWGPLYNDRLVVEAAARPNVHVIDYAGAILAKGSPWLAANFDTAQLHPNSIAAKQAVAEIIAQGVRDFCHI